MTYRFETARLLFQTMQPEDLDAVSQVWGRAEVMKYYTVLLKDISAVIGVCGFNPGENEEEAELLYHFNQHYWGKGYATELQLPVLLT
jgi:ribosomal-protein-alanine N-acetyltransferase